MRIYGTIKELVAAVFKKNGQEVTLRPNQGFNYNANRDIQLPSDDTDHVLVSKTSTDILTNKTFDADGTGNSITNIENADIKAAANIARTKLASGSANHVIVNDGSGVFSSEAQLATSRGGTGVNSTAIFPTSGTVTTDAGSSTLTNKTLLTPLIDDYLELNEEVAPGTPSSSKVRVYAKADKNLYSKDSTGLEKRIGAGGTLSTITQTSHGFIVGDVLYLNGSTYTKAISSAANSAEVVGVVSGIIDTNKFELTLEGEVTGLSGLSTGSVYFLSSSTAGAITLTEPTTIGHVSIPVGVASSPTSLFVRSSRGITMGGVNSRTLISLANNSTSNLQDVSAYEAGELTGWIYINGTTPLKFYTSIPFAKNGAGTDYNISPSYMGDTPPVGFSVTITSGGLIQITLPNISGYINASINYALNAPAVGAVFPLSISARNVLGDISGTVVPSGYVGETVQGQQLTSTNFFGNGVFGDVTSISLTAGKWSISAFMIMNLNGATSTGGQLGISTTSGNSSSGLTSGDNIGYLIPPTASYDTHGSIPSYIVNISSTTTYYLKAVGYYSAGTPQYRGRLTAIRIA